MQIILAAILSFLLGSYLGGNYINGNQNSSFLVLFSAILVVGLLIMLYYNYQMSRIMINSIERKRKLTYWYWGVMLFLFAIYFSKEYPNLLQTYEKNSYGINQTQYIFLVNIGLFFLIGLLIYVVVFQQYSIKHISKDGIELEKAVEVKMLEKNTDIISRISRQLGALDEVINALDGMGYVDENLEYDTYVDLLERILYPISENQEEVVIQVCSLSDYESYMYKEKGYSKGMVKKAFYNLKDCGIIKVEDSIHIKYKLGGFQKFEEREAYIIVQLGTLYDIKIGELIYGYIKCFEALYSKYMDNEG